MLSLPQQNFEDQGKDVVFTKKYSSVIPLTLKSSEINSNMKWYIGPNDYDILKIMIIRFMIQFILDGVFLDGSTGLFIFLSLDF